MKIFPCAVILLFAFVGTAKSHPHINKTVSASAQGARLKLTYFTLPYNAEHMSDIKEGFVFHCGRATLEISGGIESQGINLVAGEYLVRAKASSSDKWTLLLIPKSQAGSTAQPDLSKAISLESRSIMGQPESHHLNLDLRSGHGSTHGNFILLVTFGPRTVEGILSLPAPQA